MRLEDELKEMLERNKEVRRSFARELKNAHKGTLGVSKDKGCVRFVWRYKENGAWRQKGIGRNPERVKRLARAAFLREVVRRMDRNSERLKELIDSVESVTDEAVLAALPESYKAVPREFFTGGNVGKLFCPNPVLDGSVPVRDAERSTSGLSPEEWGRMAYAANTLYVENKNKKLASGLEVRSKSEAMIAEYYTRRGYYFHYDETVSLDGRLFSPDFIIARRDGKLIYHEHLGKVDDPEYIRRFLEKLEIYIKAGITPWDNLILTFETEDSSLNYLLFEAEVKAKLE